MIGTSKAIRAALVLVLACMTAGCEKKKAEASSEPNARELFEGDSPYNHMLVREVAPERCLVFGAFRGKSSRATCVDLTNEDRHVFEYTSFLFVGFAYRPETTRVATIGLGGGMITRTFRKYLPDVTLDAVEIDPLVVRLARDYFGFTEAANVRLTVDDGRQFLRKTKDPYDQILIDAFNSDYVPAHLTTKEFLLEARQKLKPGGLLIENVHSPNQLFPAQVKTTREVFKSVRVFRCNNNYNAVLVASDAPLPTSLAEMTDAGVTLERKIPGVDLTNIGSRLFEPNVGDAPILTDDYGPANLLIQKK